LARVSRIRERPVYLGAWGSDNHPRRRRGRENDSEATNPEHFKAIAARRFSEGDPTVADNICAEKPTEHRSMPVCAASPDRSIAAPLNLPV